MPSAFVRTLRSLDLDSYRPAYVLGGIALPLIGGWLAWATLSRAPVYAVTTHARTEVEGSIIPVDVSEQGRVIASNLQLGHQVAVGEILVQLDRSLDEARAAELRARRTATEKRLEPLRKQRDALLAVLEGQRAAGGASLKVATARAAAAEHEAQRGQELADISTRLSQAGLNSKIDDLESSMTAQRRLDLAREGAAEVSRTAATQALEARRLALQDGEFTRLLVDAEAELIQIDAQLQTLQLQIEHRTVRAMVAGYLGDVAPITVGMTVSPGQRLATIIPEGQVRMVAYFTPVEAVGRVKLKAPALLRFEAFPWTQFGIAEGEVASVGVEPASADGKEGGVRVEIAVDRKTTTRIPLQHGMPASVEVLVGYATPWESLMRSVGGVTAPSVEEGEAKATARGSAR